MTLNPSCHTQGMKQKNANKTNRWLPKSVVADLHLSPYLLKNLSKNSNNTNTSSKSSILKYCVRIGNFLDPKSSNKLKATSESTSIMISNTHKQPLAIGFDNDVGNR